MTPPTDSEKQALGVLFGKLKNRASMESAEAGQNVKLHEGDIIISTAPKCGTTWVQQICHQLRSGTGDMDFVEINDVVPFLELTQEVGQNVNAEQRYSPRVFKTHFWEPDVPKAAGVKYITVARHPYDVAISFYHFMSGWVFPVGDISLDTFVSAIMLAGGKPRDLLEFASPWEHYASWWPRRKDPNVLWLFYEDLKEDLSREVNRIAAFMGVTDPATIAQALDKAQFDFMKQHECRFDEKHIKKCRNAIMDLPADAGAANSKVRVGGGQRHLLSDESRSALDAKFREVCEPVMKAVSYEESLQAYRAERQRTETV